MDQAEPEPPRRTFLKFLIHGISAVFTVVLGAPVVAYLIDPLNRPKSETGFRTVDGVRWSDLEVGKPKQGVIRNVRQDAWTLHPNDVVGRVWVVKEAGDKLAVFTTVCPHLGCSINAAPDGGFACPCHGATFDVHGAASQQPGKENPAPRGMDSLEAKLDKDDPNRILVKFVAFYQGKKDKEPRA